VNPLDDLSEHHHHWHTNIYQVFEDLYSRIMRLAPGGQDRRHCQTKILEKTLHVLPLRSRPCVLKLTAWLISHAEPQIAAGREPQTMGLNLWSNVTL
jgi:hypothetical protein